MLTSSGKEAKTVVYIKFHGECVFFCISSVLIRNTSDITKQMQQFMCRSELGTKTIPAERFFVSEQ